jgi:D-alanyl-D-alanine carboxypeptidase
VQFHYSNTGYLLLGLIVERATGSQVSSQIRDRILDPLNLSSTFFAIEETIDGEIAHPWADFDFDGVLEDISYAPRTSGESTAWASGALYSSAEDVALFLRALIRGTLLDPASLDQMLDFRTATSDVGYGLGVQETYDFVDQRSGIGHDGGTYGYTARMIALPDRDVYISVLLNHSSANPADDYQAIHSITRALAEVALNLR